MTPTDFKIVDVCTKYIKDKDAVFIAKSGHIIYWASPTGRKSDYKWISQSIKETVRIIKAVYLDWEDSKIVGERHVMTSLQELGRVYEYATHSKNPVEGVFSYSSKCDQTLAATIVKEMLSITSELGIIAIPGLDLIGMVQEVGKKMDENLLPMVVSKGISSACEMTGYVFKQGSKRPLIGGTKRVAVMKPNAKPRQMYIPESNKHLTNSIIEATYNKVK